MIKEEKVLNDEQVKAIEHGQGPLLIIAGAGSGKTTVITERIKYLILKKKILASQILALTFTEKASQEMEERVDIAMPYGYTQMWISTFHAFCDRILRNEAAHIGLDPSYKLMTEAQTILFLRQNIFKFKLDYFRPLGNPNKFLQGLIQHFSRLKDEDVNYEEYLQYSQKLDARRYSLDAEKDEIKKTLELSNAYKTYEELKIKEGVMDFSDLISNVLKLFRMRKNILSFYQNQFQYILVDEFQDTNFAQNELAILLSGEKKNITVVGDDDQAIYRWRGAAISNIIQFRKRFPKAKVITLTKNYRSIQEILDRSYVLIKNNNPDRLEVKENINKKLISERGKRGDEIEFIFAPKVEDEAEQVAKKIQELIALEKRSYRDFAILVRANDHFLPFVKAFERQGLPYQFLGPGRLFHQEEIKDLIAYLKVLYNFEDSTSLYRVLNLPIFQLDALGIAALLSCAKRKNLTLFETIKRLSEKENLEIFLKEKEEEKIKNIFEMIKRHIKLVPKETAGQILFYFLKDTGFLSKIITAKNSLIEKKYLNIAKFFDKLKTFEAENDNASVFAVVDWIDLSMQMGESPLAASIDWDDFNAINILTIHSSKGLEFPVVFLVNLVEGRFPTRERREQIPIPQELIKEILPLGDYHLQEERRLFYVGLTRAKDRVFLTAAKFYGEGKRERKISPFVYETLEQKNINKYLKIEEEKQQAYQPSLLEWSKTSHVSLPTSLPASHPPSQPIPIHYLSYSQIQTFDICPLHYKLKYLLKIPTPKSAAQSFGISLHATLSHLYQGILKGEKEKQNIQTLLEKNWIAQGYDSKIHEKKAFEKALSVVNAYIKDSIHKDANPIALELPFQFFIDKLKIGGRIDRIDKLQNGAIEIFDYKTGNNIPDEKKIANDLQLTFYALAATEVRDVVLSKKPEETVLSLYFLEAGKKFTTKRAKEQLGEAKKQILKKADEIAKSDFACSASAFCQNCEYKMLCSTLS